MGVKFEWNPKKAASNVSKHDVTFVEALTVFVDPLARIFDDEHHSIEESREVIIGHSVNQTLLLVSFVARRESVRILSARKATKQERKDYEENVT